ncbi:hypothetical protein TanjilG_27667 [Lupinus angustifolius]|uniref:Uncharacterized protein n=1 Tax=Lupinus angustifolius TaxID=3871 RepID=A0A4P1RHD6_LUPAN|nr:hypothetical protein TanjilG_27667 [Lupinus angustifolius]
MQTKGWTMFDAHHQDSDHLIYGVCVKMCRVLVCECNLTQQSISKKRQETLLNIVKTTSTDPQTDQPDKTQIPMINPTMRS